MSLSKLTGKTLRVVEQEHDALLVQDISGGYQGLESGDYFLIVARGTEHSNGATLDVVKP